MKIFRFNFWKLTSFILFFLTILVAYEYLKEYRKNLPYKKELFLTEKTLEKMKRENLQLQKEALLAQDPLNWEKERKDKFGEALEGEKVILVSEELLKSINLPMLKEDDFSSQSQPR